MGGSSLGGSDHFYFFGCSSATVDVPHSKHNFVETQPYISHGH